MSSAVTSPTRSSFWASPLPFSPIACDPKAFKRDGPVLIAATLAFAAFGFSGIFGHLTGILFLAALLAYVVYTYRTERRQADASAQLHAAECTLAEPVPKPLWIGLVFFVAGVGLVVAGADFLVGGAIELARRFGISEDIIGLTLVAVGTSLPELAASIVAAFRRHTDIAFGNIVGSNLFNILGILGVTAAITPVPVPSGIATFDLWVLLAVTALLIVFAMTRWVLSRLEGLVFVAGYLGYLAFLAFRVGGCLLRSDDFAEVSGHPWLRSPELTLARALQGMPPALASKRIRR